MSKHRVIKLKDIRMNHYVRKSINTDHVLMLAELYESGMLESKGDMVKASQVVRPIQITEEGELVDGRHRKEAMELAQITEAKVEVLPAMTSAQLVVAATKANYGGALPPSREDMVYTIEQLMTRHGMTAAAIESQMVMLPRSVARKYISMANKRINETRLKLAITDISNGSTVLQAARNHNLKPEAIQLALSGKKPKTKTGASQLSAALTTYAKGFSNQTSRIIGRALEDFRDGELSEEAVQTTINHFGHLLRRMFLRAQDWENRLKAAKMGEKAGGYEDVDNVVNMGDK